MPQIFKEEKLLTAVNSVTNVSKTNQTSVLNTNVSPGNVSSNTSSYQKITSTTTCSVPVYNSSTKGVQDHVVDFITGQVIHCPIDKGSFHILSPNVLLEVEQ